MTDTIDWLLEADTSIRWQVMRDLLEEPPGTYEKEQAKIKARGWGSRLLWHYDFLGALDYFQFRNGESRRRQPLEHITSSARFEMVGGKKTFQ